MDFAIVALQLPEVIRRLSSETLADPRDARWWRVFDGLEKGDRFSRQDNSYKAVGRNNPPLVLRLADELLFERNR
jgi:hypothetical protein